jgi:hypothetical protein
MAQLAAVQRARELLLLDRPVDAIAVDLERSFGVGRVDALAAIIVARSFNRAAA